MMQIDNDDLRSFRSWLERNTTLGRRARGDVVSRAKRARGYLSFQEFTNADSYFTVLTIQPLWLKVADNSQAGIARSVRYYFQYKKDFPEKVL